MSDLYIMGLTFFRGHHAVKNILFFYTNFLVLQVFEAKKKKQQKKKKKKKKKTIILHSQKKFVTFIKAAADTTNPYQNVRKSCGRLLPDV